MRKVMARSSNTIAFLRIAMRLSSFDETDDSHLGLIGSEAIMVWPFDETDDSRFGLIGNEAIMV